MVCRMRAAQLFVGLFCRITRVQRHLQIMDNCRHGGRGLAHWYTRPVLVAHRHARARVQQATVADSRLL